MAERTAVSGGSVQRTHSYRHNLEIQANRKRWEEKPCLRNVYREFHQLIEKNLAFLPGKCTVEIGSGMGSIKEVIPECVTTDIFPNPWLDGKENAYDLTFPSASVGNLILFDVWHHLEFPGTALREFSRVLSAGGRLILFEPAMSLLGKWVYSTFHHEPVGLNAPIAWEAPGTFSADDASYFAAQSSASRIFLWGEFPQWTAGWRVKTLHPVTSFQYLLSGGFSGPQLCPDKCLFLLRAMDRALARFPNLFASRLLIVLEKKTNDV